MSAGETAKNTVAGGVKGAVKGGVFAVLGTAALVAGGAVAAGIVGALAWPAIVGLGIAGAIIGGMAGFSVLAPLFAFVGAAWRGSKEARKGSNSSIENERMQYRMTRDDLVAQRQSAVQQFGGSDDRGNKSFAAVEEQRRANNKNTGQNV